MMRVPIEEATNVFCENEYVYRNASFSESQIKKKHQAICFHQARECMAAYIIIFHKVSTNYNISVMMNKSPPGWNRVQLGS